jgi:hypothetical protein
MIEFKFDDKTMEKLISDMSDFPRLILEACQESAKAVAAPTGIPRCIASYLRKGGSTVCVASMLGNIPELQGVLESARQAQRRRAEKESYYALLNQEKIIEDFGFEPTMLMTSFNWAVEVGKIFDHDLLEIPPEKPKIKNKWIPKRARKKNERKRRPS